MSSNSKVKKIVVAAASIGIVLAAAVIIFILIKKPEAVEAGIIPGGSAIDPAAGGSDSSLIYDNEYIIVWNENADAALRSSSLAKLEDFTFLEDFDEVYTLIRYEGAELSSSEIVSILRALDGVSTADPNYIITLDSVEENDTYGNAAWALDNDGSYTEYTDFSGAEGSAVTVTLTPDIDINFPEAETYYKENITNPREVVVAVIDTGVDITHPDLAANIWVNPGEIADDGIDNDGNGYIDDIYGWDFYNNRTAGGDNTVFHSATDSDGAYIDNDNHGTHVAGIIAAVANNATGTLGAASFVPVKIMVLKSNGGAKSEGRVSDAIKAINYATAMGADVCNLSWGSTGISSSLASLTNAIKNSDMLFVCAAGNSGGDNDVTPLYPASIDLPNVMSVTFINQEGKLIEYTSEKQYGSNYGAVSVDLAAPGVNIVSTLAGGTYGARTGSSVAAPYVTALAAAIISTSDGLYPSEIKDLILSTAKLAPASEDADAVNPFAEMTGKIAVPGIPDMEAALKAAAGLSSDSEGPAVTVTRTFEKSMIVLRISADDAESGVRIIKYEQIKNSDSYKTSAYFMNGMAGQDYDDTLAIRNDLAGRYSFYVSDYAGNETLVDYVVEDDTTAPEINVLTTALSPSGVTLVVLDVSDLESGVNKFTLLPGTCTASDFKTRSTDSDKTNDPEALSPVDGRLLLKLGTEAVYTLYVEDYRGNVTLYEVKQAEAEE